MDRIDQLRTGIRAAVLVAEAADVALRVGKVGQSGPVPRHSAKLRMSAEFTARLLRDCSQPARVQADA